MPLFLGVSDGLLPAQEPTAEQKADAAFNDAWDNAGAPSRNVRQNSPGTQRPAMRPSEAWRTRGIGTRCTLPVTNETNWAELRDQQAASREEAARQRRVRHYGPTDGDGKSFEEIWNRGRR